MEARAVNELLGKISVLISRRESDTFPARKRIFHSKGVFARLRTEGAKKKKKSARNRPHTAEDERNFPGKSRKGKMFDERL